MLDKLSKFHNDWLRMVKSMGGDDFTEDIVQEMYLKIYSKGYNALNDKGEVNKFYVYLTLKSILMSYFVEKSKVIKVSIDDYNHLKDDTDMEEENAFNNLSLKVDNEINKWHWYDREIFEMYRYSGMSIRKIGSETGISFVSIYHTLKDAKDKIKSNLEKDYEKYKKEI